MLVVWIIKFVGWVNILNMSYFVRFILMVGLIIGGVVFVSSLIDIVVLFVGESVFVKEVLVSIKVLLKGGIVLVVGGFGVVIVVKIVGKFVRNNVFIKGV